MADDIRNTVTGGIFFSAVVQGRDITVVLPPQVTPAMTGLPPAGPTFTGRASVLDTLLATLDPASTSAGPPQGGGSVLVTAVGGMGGIGKTELALQAAHIALSRGWFPGGVLFVDMFGYDVDRRLTPARAAAGFVRALGIPGEHIPADPQELERLLRSVLDGYAANGRPVLMVVDNVSEAEQAAPLLPGHPACRAIVTSRHTLARLGARLIDLDTLDLDAAADLLDRAIRTARPGDGRVTGHPHDARRIAQACGGLPLALRIVAALLAAHPSKPLAAMADDLTDPKNRLAELADGGDALTVAFDLSYTQLPTAQARLFRLFSLNPGPDISTPAAAALTGRPEAEVRRDLEALARAHLIEPGATYGRWRMHDLLRLHSAHHGEAEADTDQRDNALARLLDYYLATVRAARAHLDPAAAAPAQPGFATREQALAWLDAEYLNLTAATSTAYATGHLATARDLPQAMGEFLQWRRHFDDWITLGRTALDAARALRDRNTEGAVLNHLGVALDGLRRFEEAVAGHQEAAQIYRETGDRQGEGAALNNLGDTLRKVRRFDEAIAAHEQAAQIFRETGDRHSEGTALVNLGNALVETRRFEEGIAAHEQAAQIFRETGDRHAQARALNNLGVALREVRRFEEGIAAHEQAAQIYRETGDRHGEGTAFGNLGLGLHQVQRFDEAITACQIATQIFHRTHDRHGEGLVRNNLGLALAGAGRFEEAVAAHEQAAQIFRETGDRHGEAMAVGNLGLALAEVRRFEEAIAAHEQAARIYRETGDRHGEAMAVGNLGLALAEVRRFAEAITALQNTAQIFAETGDPYNESIARQEVQKIERARDAAESETSPG